MSQSIPPNSSSDRDPGADLRALIARLAEEFGADEKTVARVASVFRQVRESAPDLFVPAAGALPDAFANAGESTGGVEPIYAALGEWALDAEGEPIERMRRDCLRLQNAMTRGALRLYASEPARCEESLLALQRFGLLQVALLASVSARSQEGGGVVRTLPTPEYAAFMEILRTTIESHRQEGKQLGLLLLQTAKVEQVDRLLGLQRGEAFMLRVARRMREGVLRRQDQLGRVSRDQFACLLPRIAGVGVATLAANKILGALEAPIPIGEHSFDAEAAIGIAMYPEHGADPQTLVRNGKLAVRAARTAADRVAVYEPAQGESEEVRMRHEERLRDALERGTLGLAFEPQLDVRSGRIGALACVLRWDDAESGPLSDAQAMESAESSGLAAELTWWAVNNALRLYAEFARAGLQVPIVVKVAASSLLQPEFPDFVDRALRTWKVPPDRMVIEIPEAAVAGDAGTASERLAALKAHGLRLGIDSFGAGSSSLSSLARVPLDEMRLGAAFVGNMGSAAGGRLVSALVHLARELGLRVVADGVADAGTARALSELGCERIQGAHVSPPLSAQEVLAKYAPQATQPR